MQKVKLNLTLTKKQKEIYAKIKESNAPYIIFPAGRRFGKTEIAVRIQAPKACKIITSEDSPHGWISPVFRQAKIGYGKYRRFLTQNKIPYKVNKTDLFIDIFGDSNHRVQFFSADRPELMEGLSLKTCVIEEAGILLKKREVWENTIQPMLIDHNAPTLFIGTPKGKGLYHELYLKGIDAQETDYISLHATSYDNTIENGGYLEKDVVDRVVRNLPEKAVQQEIYAEFIDDAGSVFRNVRSCVYGKAIEANRSGIVLAKPYSSKNKYIGGLDIAKVNDWNVLAIGTQKEVHYIERFNNLDWHIIKERIAIACKKYKCKLLMDSTGVGDPIYEDLRRMGVSVEGYKYTSQTKQDLINKLIVAFENKEILIPNWKTMIDELEVFEYDVTSSGNIRMNAPSGYHDDIVNSLALWNWLRSTVSTESQLDSIWIGDDIESARGW